MGICKNLKELKAHKGHHLWLSMVDDELLLSCVTCGDIILMFSEEPEYENERGVQGDFMGDKLILVDENYLED